VTFTAMSCSRVTLPNKILPASFCTRGAYKHRDSHRQGRAIPSIRRHLMMHSSPTTWLVTKATHSRVCWHQASLARMCRLVNASVCRRYHHGPFPIAKSRIDASSVYDFIWTHTCWWDEKATLASAEQLPTSRPKAFVGHPFRAVMCPGSILDLLDPKVGNDTKKSDLITFIHAMVG
jgi:hypothetical protein